MSREGDRNASMRERRLAFATTASTALKTVPSERSEASSALVQAIQKTGPNLGAAIPGQRIGEGLSVAAARGGTADKGCGRHQQSVFAGVAVAMKLHSASPLESVREAFVHGMDAALVASAMIAAVEVLMALVFMPGRAPETEKNNAAAERVGSVA